MENSYKPYYRKKGMRILLHFLYWILSFLLLSRIFANPAVYKNLAYIISAVIIPVSLVLVYGVNHFLIPGFLFKRKYFIFFYLIIGMILISVWINFLLLTGALYFTSLSAENMIIPDRNTVVTLMAGNYLIVFLAIIIHFITETAIEGNKIRLVEKKKYQLESKLNEAKLELLKGQIHPHFLFNTLNNLYGLCLEKSDKATDMVLKISELLDYMLYRCNKEKVSLDEELEFLKNYIDLEKIRNDQRLELKIQFPFKIEEHQIAPLLLFPFIENAFKHSALNNPGKRSISILIEKEDANLRLQLVNSFVEYSDSNNKSGGLGLENVRNRLNLIYPKQHCLNIASESNIYKVDLSIDLNNNGEEI